MPPARPSGSIAEAPVPAVVVDPKRIRGFRSPAAFERWLAANHAKVDELWLKIHKKASGQPTVTYAEAVDVALCWGWIDGITKRFDEASFLQRFTPRRAKSVWSRINRGHVARLGAAGRMTEHGLAHVEAAKRDGRWDAAYAPIREASIDGLPADLRAAIGASPAALAMLKRLDRQNLFALAYRTQAMKTPAGRARKIAALVDLLAKGETIVPQAVASRKAGVAG